MDLRNNFSRCFSSPSASCFSSEFLSGCLSLLTTHSFKLVCLAFCLLAWPRRSACGILVPTGAGTHTRAVEAGVSSPLDLQGRSPLSCAALLSLPSPPLWTFPLIGCKADPSPHRTDFKEFTLKTLVKTTTSFPENTDVVWMEMYIFLRYSLVVHVFLCVCIAWEVDKVGDDLCPRSCDNNNNLHIQVSSIVR